MFPSNMISPLMPNAPMNHVYQYVQPPMAQAPPAAQPDMIVTSAPRQQSVIQGRVGHQAVDGSGYNYVNGDLHNTQYSTYILTPTGGPSPHQPNTPSHAPPTGSGNSVPAATSNITGGNAQQFVDYSMSMAASGFLPTPVPQGVAGNMQPSTTSGQLMTGGQFSHYALPGQLENTGQTGNNPITTHSSIDPSSPLWKDLQRQLEYYFSPQNLGNDKFLREHMDAEGYVPISLIAGFNKVISMTTDLQLVTDVLRDSKTVQVDENGEKVRSLVNSGMLILREIPENTPVEEVRQLFNSDRCPPLISCHFMHNDNWLARFESHDDATRAYTYLRESRLLFRGQPIHARLKNPHGSIGLKSPDGLTSPTTPPARQTQPQYPAAPVPQQQQQATGIIQPVQPPQYQPSASQPVVQQQAVYQQAANASTRVYTPQPAPQQVPPQMVSQTAGNMVGPGPQTIQSVPPQPPAGIPAHQLPPGAAVQLLQPQPNFTVVPSNAPWPEQYAFYNPLTGQIMQLTARQPTPVVYDFAPTRMVAAYPDVRYRPPARAVMLPVVHPGFSNAAGANPNSGPFAISGPPSRPMRRDSNSRSGALRPSSGSNRYDYSGSRLSQSHNTMSTEHSSPATIDVASSTDVTTMAEPSVLAMSEPASMSMSHADASTSALHQPELSAVMEPLPRRGQAQNWRHNERDSGTSRPGARPGRRGGRHQEDSRTWNAREAPVEQKFNFEDVSFPPLTSTHQQTTEELLLRHAPQTPGSADVDPENQPMPVSGPTIGDHGHLRDVGQLTDSMSASCNLSDRNAVLSSGALCNDVSPVDTSRQSVCTAAVSPARPSYAQIITRGGNKDQPQISGLSIGTSDMEQFPAELHLTVDGNGGVSVPNQSRHMYQHSDVPPIHNAAQTVPPHSQNDSTDRHVPPRRGGRGGGGANRPYRMFFPSDNSSTRGGSRWRGGHSHDGSGRIERTIHSDEPAQLQTS